MPDSSPARLGLGPRPPPLRVLTFSSRQPFMVPSAFPRPARPWPHQAVARTHLATQRPRYTNRSQLPPAHASLPIPLRPMPALLACSRPPAPANQPPSAGGGRFSPIWFVLLFCPFCACTIPRFPLPECFSAPCDADPRPLNRFWPPPFTRGASVQLFSLPQHCPSATRPIPM